MWRINWCFYLWILCLLLFCTIRYDRLHANIFFLWLHDLHMLWFLPHARNSWFPCFFTVCPPYIPLNKVRVALHGWTRSTCCFIFPVMQTLIPVVIDFVPKWYVWTVNLERELERGIMLRIDAYLYNFFSRIEVLIQIEATTSELVHFDLGRCPFKRI